MKISHWNARPSEDGVTITGRDSTGVTTRLSGIGQIWPGVGVLNARDRAGTVHQLVLQ